MKQPGDTIIQTERLLLRPFVDSDAEAYAAIRFHPEVDTWLMPAATADPAAEQRQRIAEYTASFRDHGYGVWAVVERHSGKLAGHCGLRWLADLGATDIVWTMDPEIQGRGYAREAAVAAARAGFGLGLAAIGALIRPDNLRSQAVARGLGMSLKRMLERRPGQFRGWWEIDRAGFGERHPGVERS